MEIYMFAKAALFVCLSFTATAGAAGRSLVDYPETIGAKRRVMIQLPQFSSRDMKVELILSKFLPEADCNGKVLVGEITPATIEGYDYYDVKSEGKYQSTTIHCPDTKPQTIYGNSTVVDADSYRPLVLYVPAGIEVEYRILKAEGPYKKTEVKADENGLTCERFYEQCRAAFCTGGFQLKRGEEIISQFRFWDHKEEALAVCEAAKLK